MQNVHDTDDGQRVITTFDSNSQKIRTKRCSKYLTYEKLYRPPVHFGSIQFLKVIFGPMKS